MKNRLWEAGPIRGSNVLCEFSPYFPFISICHVCSKANSVLESLKGYKNLTYRI